VSGRQDAGIAVRVATSADASLLAELGARTFFDTFAADNTPADMAAYLAASFGVDRQAEEMADSAGTFLVAELDGSVVGYAHLRRGAAPVAVVGRSPIEIARIYADAPWIGRGVGAALMKTCIDCAASLDCDVIWLAVWERNPRAIAFYRRWGYATVGTQEFRLGRDTQGDLVMRRAVAAGRSDS
jgi:diamine N-acetyltransferase